MTNTVIPNTFQTATDTIQLSKLDENFAAVANAIDTNVNTINNDISTLNTTVENIIISNDLSLSVFTKEIYLQTNVVPASPTGGTYNFSTGTFVPPTGWFATRPPASTTPTYACEYTFSTTTTTQTITALTWSTPSIIQQNGSAGSNGFSVATIEVYSVNLTSAPTGGSYTFSTDTFDESTLTSGWSRSMPQTSITPTYRSAFTFRTNTPTVSQNAGTWSTPILVAVNGTNGIDAVAAVLSNDSHSIPTDSTGNNGIYTGSGTAIHVYQGSSELIYDGVGTSPGTWKVTVSATGITAGSITNVNPYVVIGQQSNITADTASITYNITGARLDGSTFELSKIQTFSRVRTGYDAVSYKLIMSASVLKYSNSVFSPTTITFSGMQYNINGPDTYAGRFKVYENGDTLAVYTSAADEYSFVYTPSSGSVNSIVVELYQAGGTDFLIDHETIPVVNDGVQGATGVIGLDSLTAVLTNDSQTIPTDSSGNNGVYTGSGTIIRLYEGSTELNYDGIGTSNSTWKVVTSGTGITPGTLTDSGAYVTVGDHSAMTTNTAFITYTITGKRSNGISFTLTKTQSFSKAKAGTTGTDSTSYWLVSPVASIRKATDNSLTPANVTFSSIYQTGAGSPAAYAGRFKIYEGNALVYTSAANESSHFHIISNTSVTFLKVELYLAGGTTTLLDTQTIPFVLDGPTGSAGIGGLTPIITNSNHSIPTDSSGGNPIYTGSGTVLRLFEGTTELDFDGVGTSAGKWKVTITASNITAGSITDSGLYATIGDHSAITADKATVSYAITGQRTNGSAISLTLVQSLNKTKSGSAGINSTSYSLVTTSNVLKKAVNGTLTPSSIISSVLSQTGTSTPVSYPARFKIYENGTLQYTSASDEASKTFIPTSAVEYITVEAYAAGGTTSLIDTQTIPVVSDGTSGNDSTSYWLSNSGFMKRGIDNVLTPTSLTVNAFSKTGSSSPVAYSGRFKIYENGSATPSYTSSANEAIKYYTPSGSATSITVELYVSGGTTTLLDTQTIPVLNDGPVGATGVYGATGLYGASGVNGATGAFGATGASGATGVPAITGYLTNDSHTVPTDSSGNNGVYTGSGTSINVFEGTTQLTGDGTGTSAGTYKITAVGTNITVGSISYTPGYGVVADHSAMTADTASIEYTITGKRASGISFTLTKTQTFSKSKTGIGGATGTVGVSAVMSVLSNQAHTIPTDYAGNNGTYTGSGTTIRVYEGTTQLTGDGTGTSNGTYRVIANAGNITAGAVTYVGGYATVAPQSNMTADVASITYVITGTRSNGTSFSLTAIQTFSKAKAGGNGSDSTAYWLSMSAAAIRKSSTAVYTPTTVTGNIYSQTGAGSPGAYSGRFIVSTTTDGINYTTAYTSAANESSYTYTIPANITAIRFRVYLAGGTTTLIDEQIVPIVTDGAIGATGSAGVNGATGSAGANGTNGTNGINGDSSRIAYAVTALGGMATSPSTITTSGSGSFPPNGSWAADAVWNSVPPSAALNAGDQLFQTNGIYSVSTNNTVWGLPYLSNLKVGSLSALSADLGSITAGAMSINNKFIVDTSGNVTIKNASSGARTEIKNNVIKVYDANGVLRVKIGDLSA